jgi:riboflavin kinase / FMN adenylyltransferase
MFSLVFLIIFAFFLEMKVWENIEEFKAKNPVVTIGIFDGVHLGHQYLLYALNKKAKEINGESVIITLWPHPRIVLNKSPENLRYLSTLEEKAELLQKSNLDHLAVIPFNNEFADQDSCSFVYNYLVKRFSIKHLLVGYNHKFGKGREGNFESLKDCAGRYGFGISQISPKEVSGERISSSMIRELLMSNELEKANKFLGYNYFLKGKVVEGNKLGRKIGFPTANIELLDAHKLIPSDGVYAVRVTTLNKSIKGMLNVGFRPTLNSNDLKKTIEVNLFDFDEDLYNNIVRIEFVQRLRNEKKFDSIEQLQNQLVIDREMALLALS